MIHAKNLTKKFGKTKAVDDVSFSLDPSESLALWGSNGAGKTTLIRCLLGIFRFDGSVQINGVDVAHHGKNTRSMVGYVPQELAFHDDARLGRSINFFAKLRGLTPRDGARVLDVVNLSGHEHKRVRDLSGGMKQRLALAIALIADPPIVILDEPTSNLDESGRNEVVHTLGQLRQAGKTLVFASHRPDEVHTLASRVLVMELGKVVNDSTPDSLWPSQSMLQTMRLHVSNGNDEDAARVLRDAGHSVHINGQGLCVRVSPNRKGDPVSALANASIVVRDFELIEGQTHFESISQGGSQ